MKGKDQTREIRIRFNLNNEQDRLLWTGLKNFIDNYNNRNKMHPLSLSKFSKALYAIFFAFSGLTKGIEVEGELFSTLIKEGETPSGGKKEDEKEKIIPFEMVKGLINQAALKKE